MPQIQLLDGKKIPFSKSITGFDLAKEDKQISRKDCSDNGS